MGTIAEHDTYEETVTESGSDDVVEFGTVTGAGTGWLPCGAYYRASLTGTIDTNGTDVTVLGKRTANAPSETIQAQATYATGTQNILNKENIEGFAYIQIKSEGTAADSNSFYLLLK